MDKITVTLEQPLLQAFVEQHAWKLVRRPSLVEITSLAISLDARSLTFTVRLMAIFVSAIPAVP